MFLRKYVEMPMVKSIRNAVLICNLNVCLVISLYSHALLIIMQKYAMKNLLYFLIAGLFTCAGILNASHKESVHTYSIVAYDPVNGDLGVAVQSKFLGVGPVVPWVEAGVGAIATQAWANTQYGPDGFAMLKDGKSAGETGQQLIRNDENANHRQVGIVDAEGGVWVWTGDECHDWAGHIKGENFTVQGNLLADEQVVRDMADAFEETGGDLAVRLLAALRAGEDAGGDRRGSQSSALMVYRKNGGYAGYNDRFIDLRVEDHDDPVGELERIFLLWEEFLGMQARARTAKMFEDDDKKDAARRERDRIMYIADRMVERDSEDVGSLIRIGWLLINEDVHVEHGLQLAQKAVLLAPENRDALYLLGEGYYKIGEHMEAIEAFEYALSKFPGDQQIKSRLREIMEIQNTE